MKVSDISFIQRLRRTLLTKIQVHAALVAMKQAFTLVWKVVQASHHQGSLRYGEIREIQCAGMSLLTVSWTLYKRISV